MSISDDIRALGRDGVSVAEIALRLGIRYQHAYKVLKDDRARPAAQLSGDTVSEHPPAMRIPSAKPSLSVGELVSGGFEFSGRWVMSEAGDVTVDRPLPKAVGVYAFAKSAIVLYVGVATMGLAKRLYFYGKPGITQRTSLRINAIIKDELLKAPFIEIYTAVPPDLEWNGLPIHGSAGLELGLIKRYALPWNMRSAG